MRLSLSFGPEECEPGRYRLRDSESSDDSSSDDEFKVVSKDDFEYSDSDNDDDDDDYAHPVGFPAPAHSSWGRTRFSLDPTVTPDFIEEQWKSHALVSSERVDHPHVQSYPPLSSYIDPKTAPTSSLLRYDDRDEMKYRMRQENDREIDQITQLLQAASIVDTTKLLGPSQHKANETPLAILADAANSIQQRLQKEQRQMEKEHMEAAKALKMLLERNEEKADKLLREEKRREEEDAERQRQEQEEENERIKAQEEKDAAKRAQNEKKQNERRKVQAEAEAKEAAKTEYLVKAKKLVTQLKQLRETIEPFEKSKDVSKRRLNMKKIVRGKVNTLSENTEKIKSVAAEVGQAIAAARAEDEDLKKQQQAGNTQISPEMTRGKRYLLDLLASSIMVRVQAEGCNGLRGDCFPIANMLALISIENKELVPIMAAHIYTVCPTAIPKLPTPSSDASEEELMKSLGMSQGKDGEYETFSRFLLRTEAIISLVADIVASNPPNHQLLGGHKGGVEWLTRFLSLIPAPPQNPLPLLTAPVLNAFLVGAGHMLANKHPEEFKAHLETIENDILHRLDEGPIGEPSAIRLKKTMKEGFDGFKNNLPPKALPELYSGANGSSGDQGGQRIGGTSSQASSSNPFGSASGGAPPPSDPFGGGGKGGMSSSVSNPFGASNNSSGASSSAPNPFGGGGGSTSSTPFGGPSPSVPSSSSPSMADPFGGGASSSSTFGQQPIRQGGMGGAANSMEDEMGASQPSNPFGASSSPATTPFGGNQGTSQSTPGFGGGGNTTTPFGASSMSSGLGMGNTNPFGAPANSMASPSPFGGPTSNPSPFGAPAPTSTPFGQPAQSPSPFGAPSPSPFSAPGGQSNNPFGGGSSGGGPGGQSSNPFGGGSAGGGPFGASNSMGNSPFGTGSQQVQSSPFGGGMNAPQSTPFAGGRGGGGGTGGGFGGGRGGGGRGGGFGGNSGQGNNNKPPCKFYAQGRCKYGANCRFSHG